MLNVLDIVKMETIKRGMKVIIIDIKGKPEIATLLRVIKSSGEYLVQLDNGTRQAFDGNHVFEYYEEFIDDCECYNYKQMRGNDLAGWTENDIASLGGVVSLNKAVFWGGAE